MIGPKVPILYRMGSVPVFQKKLISTCDFPGGREGEGPRPLPRPSNSAHIEGVLESGLNSVELASYATNILYNNENNNNNNDNNNDNNNIFYFIP